MDFLDKLSSLGKSAGGMVNDTIEITKMNTQITALRKESAEAKIRLGDYYWQKFAAGDTLDEAATEISNLIADSESQIAELQTEINRLRGQQQAPKSADCTVCASCSKENSVTNKFCSGCGVSLVQTPESNACPTCGESCKAGAVFCGNCGTKLS